MFTMKSQKQFDKTFSFELFPPKTEAGMEKLQASVKTLAGVNPLYFSVTFGAGGSTRERTFESVSWLRSEGYEAAPHLSCIGSSRQEIVEILNRYREQGIHRVVAAWASSTTPTSWWS
jgi:methylenetetrahydrofolate reductase (NADPH)